MVAKQFRERIILMSSRDAFLKGKETRRSPEGVKMRHEALGVRTELGLHVVIMFVQVLPFLIYAATPLDLFTSIFLGRWAKGLKCETGHRSPVECPP